MTSAKVTAHRRVQRCALVDVSFRTPPDVFGGWMPALAWLRCSPLLDVHRQANDNAFTWVAERAARRRADLERLMQQMIFDRQE